MSNGGNCGPILVVDDDHSVLELLTELLCRAGYEVQGVTSGEEAARCAETCQPALAILDVCLPDLSGYELCRRLRERYGNLVAIMFLSGERIEAIDRVAGL